MTSSPAALDSPGRAPSAVSDVRIIALVSSAHFLSHFYHLVRAATPAGASGKVFGFVYSGLDVGTLLMPPIDGWLMDRGAPAAR